MENLHQYSEEDKSSPHNRVRITIDHRFEIAFHKRAFLQTFDQHKIKDGSCSQTTEQPDEISRILLIIEGKDQTGDILDNSSEEESDRHRKENGKYHRKCLIGVQQVAQLERTVGIGNLD